MTLKKRIIGFLLLLGIILIAVPLFFGRSIPSDELKLSGRTPVAPPKPTDIAVPIPPQTETVPEIALSSQQSAIPAADSPVPTASFDTEKFPVPMKAPAEISPIKVNAEEDTAKRVSPLVPVAPALVPATSNTPVATSTSVPAPVATVQPSTPLNTQVHRKISQNPVLNTKKSKTTTPMEVVAPSTVSTASPPVSPIAKSSAKSPAIAGNNLTSAQQKTGEKPAKSTSTALKNPAQKTTSLPPGTAAWAVQLGSFTDKHNAEKLTQKLQSQGYAVYTQVDKTMKGTSITKVMVGPNVRREDAEQLRTNIQKDFGLQGAILVKVKT